MKYSTDFDYNLPGDLIAQSPLAERADSRLLIVPPRNGDLIDSTFSDLTDRLIPGDLLVVNETKVLPARLHGQKSDTGGKVELMLERLLDERTALVQLRASKSPGVGTELTTTGGTPLQVLGREGMFFVVGCNLGEQFEELLHREGETPLPPYIERPVDRADDERYQTVYARHPGAVAAPTAGLHFDEQLFENLAAKDIHELLRAWELKHRHRAAECVTQHTLFRKETRWPGYYYRGDAMKVDDENWHVLTVSRRDPDTGEYTMEKAPCYHLVAPDE